MSGLAVLVTRDGRPAPADVVLAMLDAIPYRGPDGSFARRFGQAVLGHARMITTPSERGVLQPLVSERTGCAIVADIRLDNRAELRAQLADPPSKDASDTRLVLCAYEEWGMDAPQRLLGDFAFAIWDPRHKRLLCARDSAGQRTLFYREDPRTFAAASEIHQLLQDPSVPLAPDEARIRSALLPINMRRNAQEQARTYYAGIASLLPGHQLLLTPDRLEIRRFAHFEPPTPIRYKRTEEYVAHFRDLFFKAVAERMDTDTHLGALLSGGLDSSSIVCAAQEQYRSGTIVNSGFTTFSAVYGDLDCDERPLIADLQARYGFDARYIAPDPSTELAQLGTAGFRDRPELMTSGTTTLFAAAQAAGTRVLLTGELSDNYLRGSALVFDSLVRQGKFGELRRYFRAYRSQTDESLLRTFALHGVVPLLPLALEKWAMSLFIQRLDHLERWRALPAWMPEKMRQALLEENLRETIAQESHRVFANHFKDYQHQGLESPELATVASGRSIEIWRPFASRALQEFALAIPPEQLYEPLPDEPSTYGASKQLLRRSLEGMLPDSIRLRTGQTHFSATFNRQVNEQWEQHAAAFGPDGKSHVGERGYIDPTSFWEGLHAYRAGRIGPDFAYVAYTIGLETWLRNLDAPRRAATTVVTTVRSTPAVLVDAKTPVEPRTLRTLVSGRPDSHTILTPGRR